MHLTSFLLISVPVLDGEEGGVSSAVTLLNRTGGVVWALKPPQDTPLKSPWAPEHKTT
jgi:hypothetical protein